MLYQLDVVMLFYSACLIYDDFFPFYKLFLS